MTAGGASEWLGSEGGSFLETQLGDLAVLSSMVAGRRSGAKSPETKRKGGWGEEGGSFRPLRFGLLLRVCAAAGLPLRAGGGRKRPALLPFYRLFEDGVGGVVILRFVKIDL